MHKNAKILFLGLDFTIHCWTNYFYFEFKSFASRNNIFVVGCLFTSLQNTHVNSALGQQCHPTLDSMDSMALMADHLLFLSGLLL
jgi:hypothetical protein